MKSEFRTWLFNRFPAGHVAQSRLANCRLIEDLYGELDRHFERDKLEGIIDQLRYSKDDQRHGRRNPSKIPLVATADIYNNLATYRSALNLYRTFREEGGTIKKSEVTAPPPSTTAPPTSSPSPTAKIALASTTKRKSSLSNTTVKELLTLQADILAELRSRGVVRSSNAPTGDYAETLFSCAFGWTLKNNSQSGYDAIDSDGTRYQIKCRRLTSEGPSRQMSAFRNLASQPSDFLAALLFDESFHVQRAALIPHETVVAQSTFTEHVNAHRFMLRDSVWNVPGVRDVTDQLRRAERELGDRISDALQESGGSLIGLQSV